MESQNQRDPVSPLASPAVHVARPEYASVSQRTSDESTEYTRDQRSRFQENIDPGLGIQMMPIASPKGRPTPKHYRYESTPKAGLFSPPLTSPGPRPLYARTPDTLYSFGSGLTRARTDPMTERLIAHRATQSAIWHIHWRIPALMVFAFLMGVVFALFQHFLYRWLHNKDIEDEDKKFRYVLYGRALAYCAKVAFGGCAVLVLRQRIWRAFRECALSVTSIDQLFGATEDPSIFGNWEAITSAPFVVIIAIIIWLIPLATVIFSPGALTFGDYLEQTTLEIVVPTIDFTAEASKSWRAPVPYEGGGYKRSVMYYNTTSRDAKAPGLFDYYDQPSAENKRIALLLAYNNMGHPNGRQDGRQKICGPRFNCTYEQTFVAPGYQCMEVAKGINDTGRLRELGAPFDTTDLAPTGRFVYQAEVDFGAYKRPQLTEDKVEKGPGGYPIDTPPDDLGVFTHDPVLWLGYSYNTSVAIEAEDPLALNWTHRYEPRILRCVHMETEYNVSWNWKEPLFHTMVSRKYLKRIVDTNYTILENGTIDESIAPGPKENYISPRNDVSLYKKTAAYYALGEQFRNFLRGRVELEPPIPGPGYAVVQSDHFTNTRLVTKTSEPKQNLSEEIESFYTDMVLSLFSAPEMLAIGNETAKVNRTQYLSSFVYVPKRLWQCYAPVIFITLIILAFGALTIWEDGTTFSTGFSRILVTTRNTTLDDISRGACLGNDPFPIELMHTRLKFGVLNEHTDVEYQGEGGYQSVGHCAFGVASEVGPIQRGMPYAGLVKRQKRQDVEKDED